MPLRQCMVHCSMVGSTILLCISSENFARTIPKSPIQQPVRISRLWMISPMCLSPRSVPPPAPCALRPPDRAARRRRAYRPACGSGWRCRRSVPPAAAIRAGAPRRVAKAPAGSTGAAPDRTGDRPNADRPGADRRPCR